MQQLPLPLGNICFQLWDFSIDDFFSCIFLSLGCFFVDLVSSVPVSPRHTAVIITFLGGVYFLVCLVFVFLNNFLTLVHICLG